MPCCSRKRALCALGVLALAACGGQSAWEVSGHEVETQADFLKGIQSDAPTCSLSRSNPFSRVTDCRNASLPPPPSIRRRFVRPRRDYAQDAQLVDSARTKPFSARSHSGSFPQTVVLPTHRTTVDGRLATVGVGLSRFNPENLDLGFQTFPDPARRVMTREASFFYHFRIDPRPGKSRIPQALVQHASAMNTGMFWEVCNGTPSPEGETQVRRCRARPKAFEPAIEGECYDLTLLFGNFSDHAQGVDTHWELRSLSLTVFSGKEKSAPGARQPSWEDGVLWYYPRSDVEGLTELPPSDEYAYPAPAEPEYSYSEFVKTVNTHCGPGSKLRFCNYLNEQKAVPAGESYLMFTGPETSHAWSGKQANTPRTFHGFLEPATTADGQVLFIHDYGQGIMYSVNEVGPCDASGFKAFKPLSQAYLDPSVNRKYGFARYPIRDTQGRALAPGTTVAGAYPWVDRKGNNLLFPLAQGQDGFRGTWLKNPEEEKWKHHLSEVKSAQVNQLNSVGVVVVGAWTRGKMVALDNGLNPTDWSFSPHDDGLINHRFQVPLYQNEEILVRPAGTALVNSLENAFNHYNALNPVAPFDVVWVASSTQERNAEIVFDPYLRKGALVVAHMNSPMRSFPTGKDYSPAYFTYDNGFEPTAVDRQFRLRTTPKLQNASTGELPATIELRGGAFVPPVAEGGVLGKGVFLDGLNDHLWVQKLPGQLSHFYLGVFVDLRPEDTSEFRTLYRLGNGFRVRLRPGAIEFVNARGDVAERPLAPPATTPERYFHLGLSFDTTPEQTDVRIFLDGTFVDSASLSGAAHFLQPGPPPKSPAVCPKSKPAAWVCQAGDMTATLCQNGQALSTTHCAAVGNVCSTESIAEGGPPCVKGGTLVLGNDRVTGGRPVRAWLDEFRLYELGPGESATSTFAELACNEALGSLLAPGKMGSECAQLPFRFDEPADEEGVGSGLDFPLEAYTRHTCGGAVHRDSVGPSCARNEAFGTQDRQVVAHLPRPDFSDVAFCTGCHASREDRVEGLRPEALLPGAVPARVDRRRQPMSWFWMMPGRAPMLEGQPLAPWGSEWNFGLLDDVHLGPAPTVGPLRGGPYLPPAGSL